MAGVPVFTRYDLCIETAQRQGARRVSDDALLQRVADSLVAGDEEATQRMVADALRDRARSRSSTAACCPA